MSQEEVAPRHWSLEHSCSAAFSFPSASSGEYSMKGT